MESSNTFNIKREETDDVSHGDVDGVASAGAVVPAAAAADATFSPTRNNERNSSATNNNNSNNNSSSSNQQFPWKLWDLLSQVEKNGDDDAISWVPGTDAFKVHNKQKFANQILPAHFNATKYKSFQRNLNLWGFETITEGPNKGACYHKLFIRNNRDKCHYMSRQKVKGSGKETTAAKQDASLRPQSPGERRQNSHLNSGMTTSSSTSTKRKSTSSSSMSGLGNRAGKKAAAAVRREIAAPMSSSSNAASSFLFGAGNGGVGVGGIGGGLSLSASTTTAAAPPFSFLSPPDDLKQLSFTQKIHHFLSQEEYDDCVTWTPDGRCIRIVDPFRFQERISPKYFSYTSFSSFLCELSDYGFQKISHAGFDECYYHDMVIRDCQHLCKYVSTPDAARQFVSENPALDLAIGDHAPPHDVSSPPSSQRGSDVMTSASSVPPSQSADLMQNLSGLLPSIQASEIVRLQQQIHEEQRQRQEQQQLQTIAGLDPLLQQLLHGAGVGATAGATGNGSIGLTVENTTAAAPATDNSSNNATSSLQQLQQLQQLQSSLNPSALLGNLVGGHLGGSSNGLSIQNTTPTAPVNTNSTASATQTSLQQLQSSLNPSLLLGGAVAGAGVGTSSTTTTASSLPPSMAQAISSLFSSSAAAVDGSHYRPPSSIAAFLSNSRSSASGDDVSSSRRGGGVNTNLTEV